MIRNRNLDRRTRIRLMNAQATARNATVRALALQNVVDQVRDVVTSVNTPNGTTRKIARIVAEAGIAALGVRCPV